jgi:nucleoside-diphosphate-sugar epimerase
MRLQKYTTEIETTLYSKLYGLDTVSLRYFNVYSHDQTINGPYATAISNWMHAITKQYSPPYINGDGEQRRDMVNVEDVVSANIFCMEQENNFDGSVFEIGTGTNVSLNQIKELVNKHFPDVKFEYRDPDPAMLKKPKLKLHP